MFDEIRSMDQGSTIPISPSSRTRTSWVARRGISSCDSRDTTCLTTLSSAQRQSALMEISRTPCRAAPLVRSSPRSPDDSCSWEPSSTFNAGSDASLEGEKSPSVFLFAAPIMINNLVSGGDWSSKLQEHAGALDSLRMVKAQEPCIRGLD